MIATLTAWLGIQQLALFVVSGLFLNLLPGPDSLYVLTRSTQGWRTGLLASLGIGAGCCVHVVAAALGLSALLATSATAFAVIKLVGAGYLVWVGIGLLRAPRTTAPDESGRPLVAASAREVFMQGLLTNVLNPKVALFFLAFVPQFITPDAPSKPLAFLVLGVIFDFNSLLWLFTLALFGAVGSRWLRAGAGLRRWFTRLTGALFVGLGIRLALASR